MEGTKTHSIEAKPAHYRFALLDPRRTDDAQARNNALFASGPVFGIEVSVPGLAKRCIGNIDPQHTGGTVSRAAIEECLTAELPLKSATLATIRPDLDSIGGMAVLLMRAEGTILSPDATARVREVAKNDTFSRGDWPGIRELPTRENPWAGDEEERSLAAITAFVFEHTIPLEVRVAGMRHWLETGEEPAGYRARVERERSSMIEALERGAVVFHRGISGKLAVVETTLRFGVTLGYRLAPVVVALNPAFPFEGGEPHRKFTVCQFREGYADVNEIRLELDRKEPGWGGSPTIIGSPQGTGSKLALSEVLAIVKKYLR